MLEVLILSGGEGQRLRPLTRMKPKLLLNLGYQTMLEHLIDWIAPYHPENIHLCLGKNSDRILQFIASHSWPVSLTTQVEKEPLGTGGALYLAHRLGYWHKEALIINGDLLTDMELAPICKATQVGVALIHRTNNLSDYGCVDWDMSSGQIKAFNEKSNYLREASWVNAGVYWLTPEIFHNVPAGLTLSLEHDIFPKLVDEERLIGIPVQPSYWIDIGVPRRFLEGQAWSIRQMVATEDYIQLMPGIYSSKDVEIGENCLFQPPVIIRSHSKIEDNVKMGPNVVLEEACYIGRETSLTSSYLGYRSTIGMRCRLVSVITDQEAIVGDDVLLHDYILSSNSCLGSESHSF